MWDERAFHPRGACAESLWTIDRQAFANFSMEKVMVELKGVAHFSIPVSDVDKSIKFYTEVVGCKLLSVLPNKKITFLDAGGVCVLLIKRPAPIAKGPLEMGDGVHHAFIIDGPQYQAAVDSLREKGVEIFFEEDRRGGIIDGPRCYFRDPDGTALEFINRTHYAQDGVPLKVPT
jgi:glyoxylase I family protein